MCGKMATGRSGIMKRRKTVIGEYTGTGGTNRVPVTIKVETGGKKRNAEPLHQHRGRDIRAFGRAERSTGKGRYEVRTRDGMIKKKEHNHQEKARAKMREIHTKSNLDQNIELARRQGISYGELQARRYLANIPPIDTRIGGDR